MFAASSICSPSRAALLTGQWPQRNGVVGLASAPYSWDLADARRHLSHVLREAGYETALFGMHHDAIDTASLGFDAVDPDALPEGQQSPRFGVRTAGAFSSFLRRRGARSRPFYAQIGFFETHTPFNHGGIEPDEAKGVWVPPFVEEPEGQHLFRLHSGQPVDPFDAASMRRYVAALQGSVRCADDGVGIALDALRACGLERNTLVLFNTDHGLELPRAKWTLHDAGLRVAFILRWPGGGIGGGRTCDALHSNVDFVPTLADLTGLPVRHPLDGVSFAPSLRGAPPHAPMRDAVFALFVNEELYGARTVRYKLIRSFQEGFDFDAQGRRRLRKPVRLFDLAADPLELRDVSDDPAYAAALSDMNARLWSWLESVDDPILRGPIPTPFYRRATADYQRWRNARPTAADAQEGAPAP